MFLFLFLVLIPFSAQSDGGRLCNTYTDYYDCRNQGGCLWNGNEEGCTVCPANSICHHSNQLSCSTYYDGQYPYSDPGAAEISECYRLVTFYDASDTEKQCRKYATTYPEQIECDGVTYDVGSSADGARKIDDKYYSNTRYCSKFGATVSLLSCTEQPSFGNTIATWNGQGWNISACRYYASDQGGCLWQEKNCYAMAILKPSATTVTSNNATISYDRVDNQHNVISAMYNFDSGGYYCTGCTMGSYVAEEDKQYFIPGDETHPEDIRHMNCLHDVSGNAEIVCQCTPTPRGYYLPTGTHFWFDVWNETSIDWGMNNPPVGCPAAQTTTSTNSIGADSCHYSTETKFCDVKGCFTLSDINNWNINLN